MAMTYQNFASLGVNLNRQKYGPLDISNVFTSAADLKYYLTKGTFTEGVSEYWYKNHNEKVVPYPYEGQVLATVIDGVVEVFVLALDAEGNFETREIASKIEVDGTTIVKDADGKLSIVAPVDPDASKTYNFAYANGVYSWVEVDTATAAGQAQAIAGLTDRTVALEEAINGKGEGEEHVAGLNEKVAANARAIADEVDAREAAIGVASKPETTEGAGDAVVATGLYKAIEDAEARAKAYADAQDADTVYDDTAIAGRVAAIESNYLKATDKYDDTELAGRVAAIEGDYLKAEDKYDDAALAARVKALEDEERYDETPLANRVTNLETVVNNETTGLGAHETRIKAMEAFWATTEDATEVVDTLKEIQEYIKSDESGASTMAGNIQKNTDAIAVLNGDEEGSVNKKIADAIAPLATTEALNSVKATAEAAQTADQVSSAINAAITAENLAQYAKVADVVDNTTFEQFNTSNTSAIAAAKQEAIDAAKIAEEAKGYAVATEVASTYATKAELETHEEEIANDLLAYAKTIDVNAGLAKKLEKVTIAHAVPAIEADPENGIEAVDGIPEGVTYDGVTAKIVVDAPTRAETIKMIADKVADVTGGESAADVKLNLEAEVSRSTAKDTAHDAALAKLNGEATVVGSVAEAKALAQKGVDDASKVASDLAIANLAIAENTRQIGVVDDKIDTVNETLAGNITALQQADAKFTSDIAALQGTINGEGGHTSRIAALEGRATNLESRDTALAELIQANTDKFANYSDTTAMNKAIDDKIAAIKPVDLSDYAKSADIAATYAKIGDAYTKAEADAAFMTLDEVDSRIDALIAASDPDGDGNVIKNIQNLVEYVENNAGEIAALVTATDANTNKLAGINTTVTDYVAGEIAKIITPKASTEVTVAEDGTLGIGEVNVNKLVQSEGDVLILNGGNA